jgi:hypothetical protein
MKRRAVAAGVVLAVAYIAAVLVAARSDPFLAKPILDGLAPPPLYRWVAPPPAFAATNQAPASGRFVLSPAGGNYDPGKGTGAGVFSTGDFQVSLALAAQAIAPAPGADGVVLRITPLAPGADVTVPDGFTIAGNVIRVEATYRPTGDAVTSLQRPSLLTLAYPIVVQGGFADTVLFSEDGRRWTQVESTDHPAQQSVLGTIHPLGYFAVGQASGSGSPASASTGRKVPSWLVPLLVVLAVIVVVLAVWVRRGGDAGPRRPPSSRDNDDRAFDPWEV